MPEVRETAMRRAAFLSMDDTEAWCIYDDMLVDPLRLKGWEVSARVPWRSFKEHDWSQYDVVVVRSPWDYQEDLPLFHKALETIAAATTVENDVELMRWNSSKIYLRDVAARGCPILPSVFCERSDKAAEPKVSVQLAAALSLFEEVVIKPAVGASSFDTFRVRRGELELPFKFEEEAAVLELRKRPTALPDGRVEFDRKADFFDALYDGLPCLIQPFVPTILSEGELSLFYFGGRLSHALKKLPKNGDFRVQEEYGAEHTEVALCDVPAGARAVGDAALGALGVKVAPLYARIDLVALPDTIEATSRQPGSPFVVADAQMGYALMEVELIEPSLYFNMATDRKSVV